MQEQICIAGVDVAKTELVISTDEHAAHAQKIPNESDAIAAWLQTLPARCIVAMESSGPYHQLLARLAHAAGMRVYVLNARDVHMYAKAISARAKTDRLDAGVIVRYVREHREHLRMWQPAGEVAERLQRLLDRCGKLRQQQGRARQCLRDVADLQPVGKKLEEAFKEALEQIDELLVQLAAREPELERGAKRLQGITGVGVQTGLRLASLFTRIPFENVDAVVAYSGLDPRPNDSGTKHGRRRLSKRGPAPLRWQIYMAAFAASHSKLFKPYYQHLREKFSTTEAIVILARKLLRIAWSVWKSGKEFDPTKFMGENACEKT